MTTRQTASGEQVETTTPGVSNLPTGYDLSNEPTDTVHIPPCGVEDVDLAIARLFDKEIGFVVRKVQTNSTVAGFADVPKPPVVFASGERFALAKKLQPFRDQNKVLMLPLISVRRTGLEMVQEDLSSRGMNQSTGALVLKKRLDRTDDRNFQAVLNRYGLTNLPEFSPRSRRENAGDLRNAPPGQEGALLDGGWEGPESNVYEVFVVPQPRWFTAVYEVIYWTNFHQHMNYLVDTTMASFLPQGRDWKLVTPKGYWFLASVEDGFTGADNFDNWKDDERVIKFTFTVRVKGYVFAAQGPGQLVPVRRYLSSPQVVFETLDTSATGPVLDQSLLEKPPFDKENPQDLFVLTDPEEAVVDPALVKKQGNLARTLQVKTFVDPRTGRVRRRYLSVDTTGKRSPSGETTYSAATLEDLEDLLIPG